MSRNSHPQCFNPWEMAKPSFVIHVHILLACDYNVHHCFSAPRYLQSEDCSPTVLFQLKWVKLDSLIWLYAITLAPCLSGCKNSAFLFYSTQQLCLHVQLYIKYTLIFQGVQLLYRKVQSNWWQLYSFSVWLCGCPVFLFWMPQEGQPCSTAGCNLCSCVWRGELSASCFSHCGTATFVLPPCRNGRAPSSGTVSQSKLVLHWPWCFVIATER